MTTDRAIEIAARAICDYGGEELADCEHCNGSWGYCTEHCVCDSGTQLPSPNGRRP